MANTDLTGQARGAVFQKSQFLFFGFIRQGG